MTTSTIRKRVEPPSVSLRTLREAWGLSIPAIVARIADQGVTVTADHISNVELGWKNPSDELLHAYAKALKLTRLDITTEQDRAKIRAAA